MEASADIWRYLEASRGVRRYEVEGTEGPESEAATELAREAARRFLDEKVEAGEVRLRAAKTSAAPEGVSWRNNRGGGGCVSWVTTNLLACQYNRATDGKQKLRQKASFGGPKRAGGGYH